MDKPLTAAAFCHVVIPAADLEKAKSFYEAVFGWRVSRDTPGAKYWFFESGNVGGAFDGRRNTSERGVLLVVKVDDMQTVLDRIAKEGGIVIQERSRIGEAATGFDAYFRDPNGNEMGIFSDQ